jgi:hypothetical protein
MGIQIVHSLPIETWRLFVEQHPKGNIFHTPEMFSVCQLTRGYATELWAATERERILALMLPTRISLRGGLVRLLTTRTVVFGGVLCMDSAEGRLALRELLEQYKRFPGRPSLFTEIRNVSSLDAAAPILAESGFLYEDHLNYLIRLEDCAKSVFERIGPRTRKHIRQSLKRNEVQIVEVAERAQISLCYDLLHHAYRNAQVPLSDLSLFHAAFDHLLSKGMARFTLAFVNDEPAATSIDLLYKDVIYGWYGGINRKFVSQVPNEALMWNVLEWGCLHGYRLYDFGGAGKPTETYGVRDFKAKFGGNLVCYGRNTWVTHPALLTVSKCAYEMIRHIAF